MTRLRTIRGGAAAAPASPTAGGFGDLVGASPVMRRLFAVLERVAPTGATVLVEGETGTGKELIAEAIHRASQRAESPFVVFDCSAVTPELIDSELFGHKRGAFTGAIADRVGSFAAADTGTLFLDEIGELPLALQPRLLRALERLEIRPVGASERRRVDVRVIAATHRSLADLVERGEFREDLYYRLAVVRVEAPPLRARLDDIPLLVDDLVDRLGGAPGAVGPDTVNQLQTRAWPGNVRELRNAVARALALGAAPDLEALRPLLPVPAAVPARVDLSVPLKTAKEQAGHAVDRAYVVEALEASGGVVTRAAELVGVNRKYIQRVMRRNRLRAR